MTAAHPQGIAAPVYIVILKMASISQVTGLGHNVTSWVMFYSDCRRKILSMNSIEIGNRDFHLPHKLLKLRVDMYLGHVRGLGEWLWARWSTTSDDKTLDGICLGSIQSARLKLQFTSSLLSHAIKCALWHNHPH
jgi:hypothetical protein